MDEPVAVDAGDFFEFIAGSPFATLLVSVHPLHTFSRPLSAQLTRVHSGVRLGTIDLQNLILAGGPALGVLRQGLLRCGAPSALGVLPGYCLFHGGEMIAWETGLPTFGDVEAIARSAWLGAVLSGVTNDLAYLGRALHLAAEQVTADRVAEHFRSAIADGGEPHDRAARPDASNRDDLAWAYRVLGLTPTAADRDVSTAWRQRRREAHPDHATGDPAEFERRSRIAVEINRARDIIERYRDQGASQ